MHVTIPVDSVFVTLDDIITQLTTLNTNASTQTKPYFAGNVSCLEIKVGPRTRVDSDGKVKGSSLFIEIEKGDNR